MNCYIDDVLLNSILFNSKKSVSICYVVSNYPFLNDKHSNVTQGFNIPTGILIFTFEWSLVDSQVYSGFITAALRFYSQMLLDFYWIFILMYILEELDEVSFFSRAHRLQRCSESSSFRYWFTHTNEIDTNKYNYQILCDSRYQYCING